MSSTCFLLLEFTELLFDNLSISLLKLLAFVSLKIFPNALMSALPGALNLPPDAIEL
jgi:hypothetical protein